MTEDAKIEPKTDPPKDEPKDEPITTDPPADDPLLSLLAKLDDDDKTTMVTAITALQNQVKELQASNALISTEATDTKKGVILDLIEKAGFDIKDMKKMSLEQLEAIRQTLGQKNKAIQVTTIKKDDPKEYTGATVMVPGKGHVPFTKRLEQSSDK